MLTHRIEPPFDLGPLADRPAVFVIHLREGRPYIGRTALLKRRLGRLLGERPIAGRALHLRGLATAVDYEWTPSSLASLLVHYQTVRRFYPEDPGRRLRLRPPVFVKVLLANAFPRTMVSTRLSRSRAFQFGPFPNKLTASRFEQEVLDLFQLRRCQEDLAPAPGHPGCIYGEMMKCLRPCQEAATPDEYGSEAARLVHFLQTRGASLLEAAAAARSRFSDELNFEEARRQHERYRRIEQVAALCGELAGDTTRLCGAAVLPSAQPGSLDLAFMINGAWTGLTPFQVAPGGPAAPLDARLRELIAALIVPRLTLREQGEHIALLAHWYYSRSRETGWRPFPSPEAVPYRALVRAISKAATGMQGALFGS